MIFKPHPSLSHYARCETLSSNPYPLNIKDMVWGLYPSVKLDLFFPGFPTLKHVPHKVMNGGWTDRWTKNKWMDRLIMMFFFISFSHFLKPEVLEYFKLLAEVKVYV